MALNTEQEMLIETRIANEQKSVLVAYLLWFFLGIVSLHRFYLGRPVSAILQIISYLIVIGIIWWLIDALLIPGMVDRNREELRRKYRAEYAGR